MSIRKQGIVAIVLAVAALAMGTATAGKLEREAKVSKAEATAQALKAVPGASVKSSELEREHGRLVWSFDLATAGSPDITEVQIDAIKGGIVSRVVETPADQAKEAAADKAETARRKAHPAH